jgi:hypothetical protein
MKETPMYSRVYRDFTGAQGIVAQVDLRRGEVVEVFQQAPVPDEIEDAKRRYAQ